MARGRLTLQDRRRIARGLSEGLAYAEIARRLERPTSTVTREVMRNGGPREYRADAAQRATERRARERSAGRGARPAPLPAEGRDPQALARLCETLTAVLVASGLTPMAARVLTALFTTDAGSLTAAELVRRLQVSPASVSKAIAFLEEQGLVRREREEGRRERYLANDDVWYQSTIASARANELLAATAREGVAVLGEGSPAAERLEGIGRFLDVISASILQAAEDARAMLHSAPEPPRTD
ncbi:MarR family transcriptional regulator [Brachybacterium phenoliresistens]|uniref:MarR family transcriptional regulator n=1 Tax=Brachybacterium phenoliresistens TaxID=396014 RepID=Z9JW27_9MICO|nr:helix-turn-helix domain-containing protein [Brachybacterium phenoliresistens]EWS82218.1 MarR family transcriptional regulator [Brachybacterium phenoliresistens]